MVKKLKVDFDFEDGKDIFELRTKYMSSLSVTPIIALEIARIIHAIKKYIELNLNEPELYFPCIHGDKVKWQKIKQAAVQEFPQYNIKASTIELDTKTKNACIILARGSEEELSQLGDVTNTNLLFNLKTETVQ